MIFEKALSSLRPGVAWTILNEPLLENVTWAEGVIPPTQEEVDAECLRLLEIDKHEKEYLLASAALNRHLDQLAISWNYAGFGRALAWVGSKSPKYNAEAKAIADYGADCFTISDKIESGEIPKPNTLEEFMALLPPYPTRPTVWD
jgi:hypothetical protein